MNVEDVEGWNGYNKGETKRAQRKLIMPMHNHRWEKRKLKEKSQIWQKMAVKDKTIGDQMKVHLQQLLGEQARRPEGETWNIVVKCSDSDRLQLPWDLEQGVQPMI